MKNNGPVYNITTGKLDVPINDHMAVDMEGHMTFRIGEHNSYSPPYPSNTPVSNPWDYNNQPNYRPVRNYSRSPRRNAGPAKRYDPISNQIKTVDQYFGIRLYVFIRNN